MTWPTKTQWLWTAIVLAAVLVVDLCARVSARYVDFPGSATWWGEFAKSPGAGGLAAVTAAVIGAVALGRQLRLSKQVEADKSWWQSFEWVAGRALPLDGEHVPLPPTLAVRVLTALKERTSDPARERACTGIVQELRAPVLSGEEDLPILAPGHTRSTDSNLDRWADALEAFGAATGNSEAVIRTVEPQLFQARVQSELAHYPLGEEQTFITDGRLVSQNHVLRPDAMFDGPNGPVLVEIEFYRTPTDQDIRLWRRTVVVRRRWPEGPLIVVCNLEISSVLAQRLPPDTFAVQWAGPADTDSLYETVRQALTTRDTPPPSPSDSESPPQ